MKRLLIALLLFALMGCSFTTERTDYTEFMTEIEAKEVSIGLFSKAYATHEFVLNEEQTLYYFPEKAETNGKIYLNDKTGYYLISSGITMESKKLEPEDLKIIFGE